MEQTNSQVLLVQVPPEKENPIGTGLGSIDLDPTLLLGGLGLAVSFTGAWFWKYVLQPKLDSLRYSFKRTVETDTKINGRLYIMLEKYNASRIVLYQAHNGEVYSSGQHQWKVSITHEALANGVSSIKHWSQSEPSSDFIGKHPDIVATGSSLVRLDNNSMIGLDKLRHLFINHGVKGALSKIVKGYNKNEIIGFVEIHWSDSDHIPKSSEALNSLGGEIDKIRGLLLNVDNNLFSSALDKLWK